MERVRAIITFGDIRGFGSWASRAGNSREIKDPFIIQFYSTIQHYVKKHLDVYFKYTGDGFMMVKEIRPDGDQKIVAGFLKLLRSLTRRCCRDIRSCRYPSPHGFRIRIVEGWVYKIMVIDPNDPARKRRIPEFIEYATNTAAHLLAVNPWLVCLVTEGVVKALGRFRSLFRMRKIGKPSVYPKSVNRQDVDGLQVFQF